MSAFTLRGATWVDPIAGTVATADLAVVDGEVVAAAPGAPVIEAAGMLLAPGFVELHSRLSDLSRDGLAALHGGFTTVLLSAAQPRALDDAAFVRAHLSRARVEAPVRVEAAGAATVGLGGDELAEMGTLVAAGCLALSNGPEIIESSRSLRSILEYSSRFPVPLLLRAGEASLERGAVIGEGRRSLRLGLPSVPAEAEEIGVTRIGALVRRTGRPVHVTHVWSAAGVRALQRLWSEGLPVTASTTAHHLAVDDELIERLEYAGVSVFRPPLGGDEDRAALREVVSAGLVCVAADHTPIPPYLQDREMQAATPGAIGFETAASLVWEAIGDPLPWAIALSSGPAAVLGERPLPPTLGQRCPDLVLFDPTATWVGSSASTVASHRNQPLDGRAMIGRVRAVVRAGSLRVVRG